jgi:hypothetical protein
MPILDLLPKKMYLKLDMECDFKYLYGKNNWGERPQHYFYTGQIQIRKN